MCAGVSIMGEGYSGSLSNTPVVEPMRDSLLDDPRRSVLDSLMDGLVTVYVFPSTAVVSDEKYWKKEENQCYVISSNRRSGAYLKLRRKAGALIGRRALYKGGAYKVFLSTDRFS